ncbi:tetratricopeptide repeat protein [Fulvivirgaceae bacterium BMA12]|uniref:Tetratricopeptide repeat protein n=1 Tax=Agaribacillus aureus TaxID=3051825 RepID=A0ABT8L9A4_9BACT|nr:tetratricopeptide repeat protein [Fulvivirgaceae bacterium BMA12]
MKKLVYALFLVGILSFSGCSLSQMVKMADQQQLTVTPSPLEVHADTVNFEMSAALPVKMLKKGKVYTVNTFYEFGGQENQPQPGSIEFKQEDFPNANEQQPRISQNFSFPYEEAMQSGKLTVQGVASDPRNGKSKETPRMDVAEGVITTSRLAQNSYYPSYAPHGYNDQEELLPTNIEFFFSQGSPVLRYSEKRSDRGKFFDAFVAEKNVTRTVTITGTHSPEGAERINSRLSQQRAEAIEKFYRQEMRKYDYKGAADSINFILKPVVEDWGEFKASLDGYDGISSDEKSEVLNIVNGAGSFEDKEDALHKLSTYKKLFRDIYPKLRTAETEILTVKEKKSNAEIAILAKSIVNGSVSSDTLSDEELSFAASLTPSLSEKERIYTAATKKNDSWSSHNNLGATYLQMAAESNGGENLNKAITQFEIANKKQESAQAYINLGSAYLMQGNTAKAYDALKKAEGLSPSNEDKKGLNGVKGAIEVKMAKYSDAVSNLSNSAETTTNLFNKGLAQILSGDHRNAITTLEQVTATDNNMALAYYAAAVASARLDNESGVTSNLTKAVAADASLKEKALSDLEFRNYASNDAFRNAIK